MSRINMGMSLSMRMLMRIRGWKTAATWHCASPNVCLPSSTSIAAVAFTRSTISRRRSRPSSTASLTTKSTATVDSPAPAMSPLSEQLQKRQAAAEIACAEGKGPLYSQGLNTYRVPLALHALNRARLVQALLAGEGGDAPPRGVILLQGGAQPTRHDTDHEPIFRQESYFHWAFGVADAGAYGAISLPDGAATLFVPRHGLGHEIVCGKDPGLEETRARYGVERVLPAADLAAFVARALAPDDGARLFLLSGRNTDSGEVAAAATYDGLERHRARVDAARLFPALAEARARKTPAEVEVMRYASWASSAAHVAVMRYVAPGRMEYQLEALFRHWTYAEGGCRLMSYTPICASGPNPAILHYGHAGRPNDRMLEDGDMVLLDMGAEYHCYASDITSRCVPPGMAATTISPSGVA